VYIPVIGGKKRAAWGKKKAVKIHWGKAAKGFLIAVPVCLTLLNVRQTAGYRQVASVFRARD
jgi:hypothetical protein